MERWRSVYTRSVLWILVASALHAASSSLILNTGAILKIMFPEIRTGREPVRCSSGNKIPGTEALRGHILFTGTAALFLAPSSNSLMCVIAGRRSHDTAFASTHIFMCQFETSGFYRYCVHFIQKFTFNNFFVISIWVLTLLFSFLLFFPLPTSFFFLWLQD